MAHRLRRLFSPTSLSTKTQINLTKTPSIPDKPETLNQTINNLFNERSLDRLTQSFKAASNSYRFRCRHRIYDTVVGRLSAARRRSSIVEVIDFQKQFKEDFKREGFGVRLILLYGKARMVDDAKRMFEEIGEIEGATRTVKSFNALMTVYEENGEFGKVVDAFDDVPEGTALNRISYNILIKALCNKGKLDEALKVLDTVEENNISPCLISYNTLLNAFYGNGCFSDAEKIWERMENNKIKPDTMTFNTKVRGLVSEGKTLDALKVIDKLKELELKPDIFTFNAMINGYCKDGNLDEAKKIYVNLTTNGCSPNKTTFSILTPFLCEAEELDLALKLCNENMSRRKLVEATLLQSIVDKLVTQSRADEAGKLVDLAREHGYSKHALKVKT